MADLRGSITVTKRIRENEIWTHCQANYASAWVDLILLANDRDRMFNLNGEQIELKRGQLAWSTRRLEKEWDRSGEWIERFLKYCREKGQIKVLANRRGTIITVVNYDVYNPLPGTKTDSETVTEPGTKTDSETVTEPGTKTDSETVQKVEGRIRSKKGESAAPEIPSDQAVSEFCASFVDASRGITGIPEVWWMSWMASKLGSDRAFPMEWRRSMTLAFTADFVARHPKAMSQSSGGDFKKNAAAVSAAATGGRSLASHRFMLDKELKDVRERLDAAYDTNCEPDREDVAREKTLEAEIAMLGVQAPG